MHQIEETRMHNDAQTHDGSNEQGNPNAASSAEEQGSASAQSQTNKTSQAEVQDNFSRVHLSVDQKWLDTTQEQALEPELEIIDAHHHLWDTPRPRYLIDEYLDRKSTRLNSSHVAISYAVFCLKKKKKHSEHE